MRRVLKIAVALGLLTACAPQIPDSGAGVGFNTHAGAQPIGEPLTDGAPLPPPTAVSAETLAPAPVIVAAAPPVTAATPLAAAPVAATAAPTARVTSARTATAASAASADDIALETAAALSAASVNSGTAPIQASPSNPAPVVVSNSGISDENDFNAVAGRESIQSDADRIARNKAQYAVVAPTALPSRAEAGGQPNIVAYALETSNQPGTRLYSRTGINLAAKAQRNCRQFPSPDQAQIAFLDAGGPQRDRKGLDPDGDGFACAWDPAPFRQAVRN